jgi:DNA-binding CsgD family transcriptional regulator/pimeloyl-ACP methyl ester carboxylesterase
MDAPPIQYVRTEDGYEIAYAVAGRGQPLARWSVAFASSQTTWRTHSAWMAGLASRFRLICVDPRGTGLSKRGLPADFTFASYERDVEAIAARFPGGPLVFLTYGAFGHPVVRFALRHPQRVRAIVWGAAFISGDNSSLVQFGAASRDNWRVMLDTMAGRYATGAERGRLAEEYARNFDFDDLNIGVRAGMESSVEEELAKLTTPLLVLQSRDMLANPARLSAEVAARATNGRLVLIDGDDVYGDADQGIQAIEDFLTQLAANQKTPIAAGDLSVRELEVLRLLAAGRSNQQIADELVISLNTVRKHVSNILSKTEAANRAQAAVYARDHGLA